MINFMRSSCEARFCPCNVNFALLPTSCEGPLPDKQWEVNVCIHSTSMETEFWSLLLQWSIDFACYVVLPEVCSLAVWPQRPLKGLSRRCLACLKQNKQCKKLFAKCMFFLERGLKCYSGLQSRYQIIQISNYPDILLGTICPCIQN